MTNWKVAAAVGVCLLLVSTAGLVSFTNNSFTSNAASYSYKSYDFLTGTNVELPVHYDDSYFDRPSTEYNPDLMLFAMGLELSCGYSPEKKEDRPSSVLNLLRSIGCKDAEVNKAFVSEITMTSTGAAIGSKEYDGSTIIFLAMNGAHYSGEFGSNMLVGVSGDHKGFTMAKNDCLDYLKSFIEKKDITGDVKLLITGYSRTSAVSNLLTAYICDAIHDGKVSERIGNVNLTKESVYGFGFSVPRCTVSEIPTDGRYDNIWYTVNPYDPVPFIPPQSYGFTRYGHEMKIPVDDAEKTQKMLEYVKHYVGDEKISFYDFSTFKGNPDIKDMNALYTGFTKKFFEAVGTREQYAENYENDISNAVYVICSYDRIISDIMKEMGGALSFILIIYEHYGKEDFHDALMKYIGPVCERRGCAEYKESIADSIIILSELLVRYADGNLLNLVSDPYVRLMVLNYDLLISGHLPFLNLFYLMQESERYSF